MIVVRDVQQVASIFEHETGTLEVGADASRVDAMQLIDDDAWIARLADEVDDADDPARLHGTIQRGEHVCGIDVRRAGFCDGADPRI